MMRRFSVMPGSTKKPAQKAGAKADGGSTGGQRAAQGGNGAVR